MKIIFSPAKTLLFDKAISLASTIQSVPVFSDECNKLVKILSKYGPKQISELMSLNKDLAQLNVQRYRDWEKNEAKPALSVFYGEAYRGLNAASMTVEDLEFAQNHLIILSGLYGILKPMDLIKPYRLEMGTLLNVSKNETNLYKFWQPKLTGYISKELEGKGFILNLASNEYAKAINLKSVGVPVVTVGFKELRNGKYVSLMTYVKHARGEMAAWIIKNRVQELKSLSAFTGSGYTFNPALSSSSEFIFTR